MELNMAMVDACMMEILECYAEKILGTTSRSVVSANDPYLPVNTRL
jgi:hypothetical protein